MNNIFVKTFGRVALTILVLSTLTQLPLHAQNNRSDSKGARGLEGVWNVQVTRLNCETGEVIGTAIAVLTYAQGGTMIDWGTGNPPSRRSVGQGFWEHVSGRNFVSGFQFFRYNADGTLAGKQIVRAQNELSDDGSTLTNVAAAELLDLNGNVIANNCSTAIATRFE